MVGKMISTSAMAIMIAVSVMMAGGPAATAELPKRLPDIWQTAQYHTPAKGTADRRAIMDAARVPVQSEIGLPVIFLVSILRSDNHWAYLQAEPRNPNGTSIDWSKTRFAKEWQNDMMSDTIMVLLRKSGGRWFPVDHVVGPTDVHWYGWIDQYQVPEALFYEAG